MNLKYLVTRHAEGADSNSLIDMVISAESGDMVKSAESGGKRQGSILDVWWLTKPQVMLFLVDKFNHVVEKGDPYITCQYYQKDRENKSKVLYKLLKDHVYVYPWLKYLMTDLFR